MSIELITGSVKTINGLLSAPNSAALQLPNTFQRSDYLFTAVADLGGGILQVNIVDTTGILIGANVYIKGDSFLNGIGIVVDVSPISINVTGLPWLGTEAGYTNDLTARQNYELNFQLHEKDQITVLFESIFRFKPRPDGGVFVDLGPIMVEYMEFIETNSYEYSFKFWESWDGGPAPVEVLGDIPQAILAKKQQFQIGGGNMWENLLRPGIASPISSNGFANINFAGIAGANNATMSPGTWLPAEFTVGDVIKVTTTDGFFKDEIAHIWGIGGSTVNVRFHNDISETLITSAGIFEPSLGELLTRFKNPLMWRGWARLVSVLMDTNFNLRVPGVDFRLAQNSVDINKDNPDSTLTIFGNITPSIQSFELSKTDKEFIRVIAKDSTAANDISKTIYYKILDECPRPVAVQWLNSLGGTEMHVFKQRQSVNDTATEGTQYESPISWDLGEENRRTKGRIDISERQQILMTAEGLTIDQLEALQEIKESINVNLFLTKDGTELLPVVVVNNFTTEYETDGGNFNFSVLVELPDGVKFNKVKKY